MNKLRQHPARWVLCTLLALGSWTASAQEEDWEEGEEEVGGGYVPERRGIEFGLNFGVYRGNHQAATAFFSGTGQYSLGDNVADMESIEERLDAGNATSPIWSQVMNQAGLEAGEYRYIEYPLEMRYSPGKLVGLQTLLFFNPESALVLHIDAITGLKSVGGWNLVSSDVDTGMGSENRRTYGIHSVEDRLYIAGGYRTAAYIYEDLSWVFEIGGTALGTRIDRNWVRVGEEPTGGIFGGGGSGGGSGSGASDYNLLVGRLGNQQFLGPVSNLTSVGYGAYAALGWELMFDKGGNLVVMLRLSRDQVRLGSYQESLWHGALTLTWIVPPVDNFIKARF